MTPQRNEDAEPGGMSATTTVDTAPSRWRDSVHTACTICRRRDARPAFEVDGHRIVRCACCGHLYVSPRPPMDEVVTIYDEDYFENPAFRNIDHDAYFGYMDYLRDRTNIQMRLRQVLARIERHEWRGRILDVGCGMGLFVEVAALAGWDAWGVDLNQPAIAWAQQHVSENVRAGTVAEIAAPDGWFDCITMFDVIEHLADPRAELADVWRALRPGGLLVVVTPDAGAVMSRALGSHWLEMKRAPEHLQFFTVRGLSRMLSTCGFTAFEWHSIGKISTVRTMLADLRFYSDSVFGKVEEVFDRLGFADRVVDVDPRTKFCLYARKTSAPQPLDSIAPFEPVEVRRVAKRGLGRTGIRRVTPAVEPQLARSDLSPAETAVPALRREFWERTERYRDPLRASARAFAEPKLRWVTRFVPIDKTSTVLDVGAGDGTLTWSLSQMAGVTVGLDISHALLLRNPSPNPMVQADGARLPFADDAFDVVVEGNFLHYAPDPVSMLREMARVARRHVVLIEPNRWHLPMAAYMAANRSEWHGLRFDAGYVERLAALAGLRSLAVTPRGSVYPNQTPDALIETLMRRDRPRLFGAFVVAALEVPRPGVGQEATA
jgi:2-polyprenyl-3-methyl-5-hydroxy-6-metoxy-1,4-benzoquinol methylase